MSAFQQALNVTSRLKLSYPRLTQAQRDELRQIKAQLYQSGLERAHLDSAGLG